MITRTTIIQEVTQQAYVLGIFDILFYQENMPRESIFNLLECWGDEFIKMEEKYGDRPNWFYYDEIDIFLEKKKARL